MSKPVVHKLVSVMMPNASFFPLYMDSALCGRGSGPSRLRQDWRAVTCKRCLKRKRKKGKR